MKRKFESIEELRIYVDDFFVDYDLSGSELYGRAKEELNRLQYSINESTKHIDEINSDLLGICDELKSLRFILKKECDQCDE